MNPTTSTRPATRSSRRLWGRFALMAALIAISGLVIAAGGISLVRSTPLSGSVVGGLVTSVLTSLPELVTAIAAVGSVRSPWRSVTSSVATPSTSSSSPSPTCSTGRAACTTPSNRRPRSCWRSPSSSPAVLAAGLIHRGPPRHRIRGGGDPRHLRGGGAEHPHPLRTWPLRPPPDGRPRRGTVGAVGGGSVIVSPWAGHAATSAVDADDGAERSAPGAGHRALDVARSLFDVPDDPGGR